MIILDLNQIFFSNLFVSVNKNVTLDEQLVRHMILNSIRSNHVKFREEWGNMVIACDSASNWRRNIFPYYKASRRKSREESSLDWENIFLFFNKVRDEIRENLPYPVVQVDGAEADDIIAAFVDAADSIGMVSCVEPILIISGDKDFIQLHRATVKQYDPVRKRYISHPNPHAFLQEHILKGDTGDGVPNVLSDDDTFVAGKRLRPLTAKKIAKWANGIPKEDAHLNIMRNYARNQQLIDLKNTPKELVDKIWDCYDSQSEKDRSRLMNYFIQHKLKHLMSNIGDF